MRTPGNHTRRVIASNRCIIIIIITTYFDVLVRDYMAVIVCDAVLSVHNFKRATTPY